MSKTEDTEITRESMEVIRLKVDGSKTYVNTLRDQQTARGLSLVCPFPALEAEIPVTFGAPGADEMSEGTIHRIGVEDDPETGLPRLRLSIRSHNERATIISAPEQDLIDETSRMTSALDERAETDIDVIADSCIDLSDEIDFPLDEADPTDPSLELPEPPSEPAWVACDELPIPDELVQRMKSRKRRRVTGVAAWTAVLAIAAVGIYALARADIVDMDAVKDYVAGIVTERGTSSADDEPDPLGDLPTGIDTMDLEGNPVAFPAADEPEVSEPVMIPASEDVSKPSVEPTPSAPVEPAVDLELTEASLPPAGQEQEEPEAESEVTADSPNDVTVLLPTRWRAEYANAYRLRNPNGVVVDVPGGLVKREGWIEAGKGHPMIRSVKAVQRETGARYVVFVHGELPRFLTTTKPGGIALRLYREPADQPTASEKVASLD